MALLIQIWSCVCLLLWVGCHGLSLKERKQYSLLHSKSTLNTTHNSLLEVSVAEFDKYTSELPACGGLSKLQFSALAWADLPKAQKVGGATPVTLQISGDSKYIRKSLRDKDFLRLLAIEDKYAEYITEASFLCPICAVERLPNPGEAAPALDENKKGWMYMPNVIKGKTKYWDVKVTGTGCSGDFKATAAEGVGSGKFADVVVKPFLTHANFKKLVADWEWLDRNKLVDNSLYIGADDGLENFVFTIIDWLKMEDKIGSNICFQSFFFGRYTITEFHKNLLTTELAYRNKALPDPKLKTKEYYEALSEVLTNQQLREKEMWLVDYKIRRSPETIRDGGAMAGWLKWSELKKQREVFAASATELAGLFTGGYTVLIAAMERGGSLFADTLALSFITKEEDWATQIKVLNVRKPDSDDAGIDKKTQHRNNFQEAVYDEIVALLKKNPKLHVLLCETWISGTETSALFVVASQLTAKLKADDIEGWDIAIVAERQEDQKYTSRNRGIYHDAYSGKISKFVGLPLAINKCDSTPFLSEDNIAKIKLTNPGIITYLVSVPLIAGEDVDNQLNRYSSDDLYIWKENTATGDILCDKFDSWMTSRGALVRLVSGWIDLPPKQWDPVEYSLDKCIDPVIVLPPPVDATVRVDVEVDPLEGLSDLWNPDKQKNED